jgi:hypothetical protein
MRSEMRVKLDFLMARLSAEGYTDHRERVAHLVAQCRATLIRATGHLALGKRNNLALPSARSPPIFCGSRLVAAQSALAISQLPSEEYDYGVDSLGAARGQLT